MTTLLGYLRNAAGEGGLRRSALGLWRQKVSQILDAGVAAPQFAYGKGIAAQAGIAINTDLELEGIGLVNGIPRSAGAPDDSWVLTPGNVYLLRGVGYFDTFSDDVTGLIEIQWVDDTNAPLQGGTVDCPTASFSPITGTTAKSSSNVVEMLYLCPDDLQGRVVKLRCTGATGTASKPQSSWSAMLLQIPTGA